MNRYKQSFVTLKKLFYFIKYLLNVLLKALVVVNSSIKIHCHNLNTKKYLFF